MINFFTISDSDKSVYYLGQIFGSMNGLLNSSSDIVDINILSTMFKTFNAIVLVIAALIVLYVTVVGVVMTAHEGEFMGKKWNNLWIPLRTVFGIAALVPTGSGYSSIQIVMMWVILQGIGAANTVWNTALAYSASVGSRQGINVPTTGVSTTLNYLFQDLVCAKTAYYPLPEGTPAQISAGYYCAAKGGCSTPDFAPDITNSTTTTYSIGPGGVCGSLKYCSETTACSSDANSLECLMCKGQRQFLTAVIPVFASIADQYVKVDFEYQNYFISSASQVNVAVASQILGKGGAAATPPTPPDWIQNFCNRAKMTKCYGSSAGGQLFSPQGMGMDLGSAPSFLVIYAYWPDGIKPLLGDTNFMNTVVNQYKSMLEQAITTYIQYLAQSGLDDTDLANAKNDGWIMAGRYYFDVAGTNSSNLNTAAQGFSVDPISTGEMATKYRNNYSGAGWFLNAVKASAKKSSGDDSSGGQAASLSSSNEILSMFTDPINTAVSDANDSLSVKDTGITNVLKDLAIAGYSLLLFNDVLFGAILTGLITLISIGYTSPFAIGTGAILPTSGGFISLYMVIGPALMLFLGLLITYGALLGVYVPLIPYTIFTFGVIGWFISTIEAMVAGPLVALGILSPSGQHEVLGKAEPALMLLFNVFLRPTLMVFGLIAAMILASVLVSFVNTTFWSATGEWTKASITSFCIYLTIYVFLIVSVVNKAFSLIYVIPEKVVRWIGGQGEAHGEEHALGEMKGASEKGAAGAKAGQKGAVKQTSHAQAVKKADKASLSEMKGSAKIGGKK